MHTTDSGLLLADLLDVGFTLDELESSPLDMGVLLDRGTNTLGDVLTQTADGRDLNEVWEEFQQAVSAWNEGRSALVNFLSFNVTSPVEDVPNIALSDFEEASEFGEPKGLRGGSYFSMGYSFKWYDLAARFTWQFLAEAGSAQVESIANMAFEADNRLVFTRVLAAIFKNTNRSATINGQNYNVFALYNADGTIPPPYANNTFDGTHTHYLTSGAATIDAGDLTAIEDHLAHHGFSALTGTQLILLVNKQELAVIRTLRVSTGAAYDFVAAAGGAPWLLPTNTGGVVFPQGSAVPSEINGMKVAGAYGPFLIVENDYIPAGYVIGFATGGENGAQNPVGIREHANAQLRGLRLVKGRTPDYPLIDSFYQRGFGTGIRQRGSAVVMKITAGAYTVPTQYDVVG